MMLTMLMNEVGSRMENLREKTIMIMKMIIVNNDYC